MNILIRKTHIKKFFIIFVMFFIFLLIIVSTQKIKRVTTKKDFLKAESESINYEIKKVFDQKCNILVKINNEEGIEKIKYLNEEGTEIELSCYNKTSIGIDITAQNNYTYYFDVTKVGGTQKVESITVKLPENDTILFDNGNTNDTITGGWTGWFADGTNPSAGNYEISNVLKVSTNGTWCRYNIKNNKLVDFSKYSKLVLQCESISNIGGYAQGSFEIIDGSGSCVSSVQMYNMNQSQITFDISELLESYSFCMTICNGATAIVSKIYLTN